jgi:hypothetical protein
MRRVICTICLLLIFSTGGCVTYWYQPEKTLKQCSQDSIECMYDANKHAYPSSTSFLYQQCMRVRGYKALTKDQLPPGIRMSRAHYMGLYYATGK